MPPLLREASPDDAPAIARLHAASWRTAYRGILPDGFLDGPLDDDRQRHWATALARPRGRDVVLLAEGPDGLSGFIAAWVGDRDGFDALIDNLHAQPDRRGTGIGRRLMGAAAERLMAIGCRSVCLWLLDGNAAALGFYERLGGILADRGRSSVGGAEIGEVRIVWHDLPALAAACRR